jgi:hypothetical protein
VILALLAVLPAIAIGWLSVRLLAPELRLIATLSLGAGLGLGLTSGLYFLLLWVGVLSRASILATEAIFIVGFVVLVGRTPWSAAGPLARPSTLIWSLRAAALATLTIAALNFSESIAANPAGDWDAFSVWNVRARYLAGGSATWRNAISTTTSSGMVGAAHPGYPLLVSASVARIWSITGQSGPDERDAAPEVVAFVFALATAGLLYGLITAISTELFGLLAVIIISASESFVAQSAFQYADIPLAFFLLACVGLLALAERDDWKPNLLRLAGLVAGFAAWTKNEGLAFVLVAVLVALWRARRAALPFFVGAVFGVALTVVMKAISTGREQVFPKSFGEALHKVADPSRWKDILISFGSGFGDLGSWWAHPLLLLAAIAIAFGFISRKEIDARAWIALPIAGLLAADIGLYLVTEAELSWHLSTSNTRLVVQVWPALLFFAFLFLPPPVSAPVSAPSRQQQSSRRKSKS